MYSSWCSCMQNNIYSNTSILALEFQQTRYYCRVNANPSALFGINFFFQYTKSKNEIFYFFFLDVRDCSVRGSTMKRHCVNGKNQWNDWIHPSNWMCLGIYICIQTYCGRECHRVDSIISQCSRAPVSKCSIDDLNAIWNSIIIGMCVCVCFGAYMETIDESTSFSLKIIL